MASTWAQQKAIDLLVRSGFAVLDEAQTKRNADYWRTIGSRPGDDYLLRPMYRWTRSGQIACHRYRHSTPMAWAEMLFLGSVRHCVLCGQDTAHCKVATRTERGSVQARNRTVCIPCGRKHTVAERLEAIAVNPFILATAPEQERTNA